MAGNQHKANFTLTFNADTNQAQQQINKLFDSLNKLSQSSNTSPLGLTTELASATQEAAKLQVALKNSLTQTGSLDLGKFKQELKSGNMTAQSLATTLSSFGAEGQAAFAQLAQAVTTAEVPLRRTNALVEKMGQTLKNTIRWQISANLIRGFSGAVQSAYYYAEDLNESLNKIRIVTGQSTDQMAKFAKEANKAAKELSTTTVDYTDAALIYYQQGLDDSAVRERTNATIKMANVTGESATHVSSYMTAIWNNFDNGSKSLEYYADVITALGAATASSSEEIAEGLEKFAAVGETVGLSYEYATAALATVTAQTRQSADVVGTAFKTLFARIQDLELGETLEDGTTLGKYAEALNAIGVNVKDATGGVKEMDQILDEMGAKWGQIDKATQIAVAQAVAGTRQYTQLIALMDNWDFFQRNLGVARTSEGSLQKQADIYAESWQAARDRVTASLEEIYQKLLNDEGFIKLLNMLERIVDTLGNIIDAMGGVTGVVSTLGAVGLNVFGNQLSKAMSDFWYNLTSNTQKAREENIKFREDFNKLLVQFKADTGTLSGAVTADVYKGIGEAQINLINKLEEMKKSHREINDSEKEYLSLLTQQAQLQGDNFIQIAKEVEEEQKLHEIKLKELQLQIKRGISQSDVGLSYDQKMQLSPIQSELGRLKGQRTQAEKYIAKYENSQDLATQQKVQQKQDSLVWLSSHIDLLEKKLDSLTQKFKGENIDQQSNFVAEMTKTFSQNLIATESSIKAVQDYFDAIDNGVSTIDAANNLDEVIKKFTEVNAPIDNAVIKLNKLRVAGKLNFFDDDEFNELTKSFTDYENQINNVKKALDNLRNADPGSQAQIDAANEYAKAMSNLDFNVIEAIEVLKEFTNENQDVDQSLDNLKDSLIPVINKIRQFGNASNNSTKSLNVLNDAINKVGSFKVMPISEQLVKIGQAASSVSMSFNYLKGFFDTLSNPDLSGTEKLFSLMGTAGMLIPTLMRSWQSLNGVISYYSLAVNAASKYEVAKSVFGKLMVKLTDEEARALGNKSQEEFTAALMAEYHAGAISEANMQILANIPALKGQAEALREESIARNTAVGKLTQWFNGLSLAPKLLMGVTAALAIATVAFIKYQKAQDEANYESAKAQLENAKKKTESIKEENENINKLITSYDDLRRQQKEGSISAGELQKKTVDLCLEYKQTDLAVQALTASYRELDSIMYEVRNKSNAELVKQLDEELKVSKNYAKQAAIQSSNNRGFLDNVWDAFWTSAQSGGIINPAVALLAGKADDQMAAGKALFGMSNGLVVSTNSMLAGADAAQMNKVLELLGYEDLFDENDPTKQIKDIDVTKFEWDKVNIDELREAVSKVQNKDLVSYFNSDEVQNIITGLESGQEAQRTKVLDEIMSNNIYSLQQYEDAIRKLVKEGGYASADDARAALTGRIGTAESQSWMRQSYLKEQTRLTDTDRFTEGQISFLSQYGKDITDDTVDDFLDQFEDTIALFEKQEHIVKLQTILQDATTKKYYSPDQIDELFKNGDNKLTLTTNFEVDQSQFTGSDFGSQQLYNALAKIQEEDTLREDNKKRFEEIDTYLANNGERYQSALEDRKGNVKELVKTEGQLNEADRIAQNYGFQNFEDFINKTNASDGKNFGVGIYNELKNKGFNLERDSFEGGIVFSKEYNELVNKQKKLNDEIKEANNDIIDQYELQSKIKEEIKEEDIDYEARAKEFTEYLENQTKIIDNLQSSYSDLASITEEYNKYGFLSIDSIQKLITLEPQYARYLVLEGNQLKLNKQGIVEYTKAQLENQAIEYANIQLANLKSIAEKGKQAEIWASVEAINIENIANWNAVDAVLANMEASLALAQSKLNEADATGQAAKKLEEYYNTVRNNIDLMKNNFDNVSVSNLDTMMGYSGGSAEEDIEKLKEELDLYHDINKAISDQERAIKKLGKEQEKYFGSALVETLEDEEEALEKQIKLYQKKIDIQKEDMYNRQGILLGMGIQLDAEGNIANYNEVIKNETAAINAEIARANDLHDKARENAEKHIDKMKEDLDKIKTAMEEYEDLQETFKDTLEQVEDLQDQIYDNFLKKFTWEIELELDRSQIEREWIDFQKTMADLRDDDFLGAGTYTLDTLKSYLVDKGDLQEYTRMLNETLASTDLTSADQRKYVKEYLSGIQDALVAVKELEKEIKQSYSKLIEDVTDKFEHHVGQYEYLNDLLEHQSNLISLIYGDEAYDQQMNYFDAIRNSNLGQLDFLRQQRDYWEFLVSKLEEGTDEWAAAQEQLQETQKSLNDLVEESIENITDRYENAVKEILKATQTAVTGGLSFDTLSFEYDLNKQTADEVLSPVTQLVEAQKLANKIKNSINDTKNLEYQNKLNHLLENQVKTLQESDQVRQYDVDRANELYELTLKQMALEDARNAKDKLRLARDSQGNWVYQFTADLDKLNDAENAYLDEQNKLFELDTDALSKYSSEYVKTLQDMWNKIQEVATNQNLGDSEKEARKQAIISQYQEILNSEAAALNEIQPNLASSAFGLLNSLQEQDESVLSVFSPEQQAIIQTVLEGMGNDYIAFEEGIVANWGAMKDSIGLVMTDINTMWDSSITQMADNFYYNEDSLYNVIMTIWDQIKEAEEEWNEELEDIQEVSGENFELIADNIGKVNQETISLVGTNSALLGTIYAETAETFNLVAELQNLLAEYSYVTGAAMAAAEAAKNYALKADDARKMTEKLIPKINELASAYERLADAMAAAGEGGGAPSSPSSSKEKYNVYDQHTGSILGSYFNEEEALKAWKYYQDEDNYHHNGTIGLEKSVDGGIDWKQYGVDEKNPGVYHWIDYEGGAKDYSYGTLSSSDINTLRGFISGMPSADYSKYIEKSKNIDDINPFLRYLYQSGNYEEWIKKYGYDTGGYTGDWSDGSGKLAILHKKELVLNQEDTENILEAVKSVRGIESIGNVISSVIDKMLNKLLNLGQTKANYGNTNNNNNNNETNNYTIYADFPNASSATEIQEAFLSLGNYASQYAWDSKV